ncbi:hypothetical protein PLICRDRAFT_341789 [Plicaturopsis crispa FD-325 SS-3]|uniref:Unplaced genomic scaffold PLICRscaffold_16, whole genome shotgun sequence n=1 Tax=Plicaturopsis crispa FD-325 SS-3 TaxID=944288 RepID=A0A0C9SL33_PLICR|nr:hypothetical protein PLICRDRAFT_341789 [Plicaturopsis crispa FD-325 SS-3]
MLVCLSVIETFYWSLTYGHCAFLRLLAILISRIQFNTTFKHITVQYISKDRVYEVDIRNKNLSCDMKIQERKSASYLGKYIIRRHLSQYLSDGYALSVSHGPTARAILRLKQEVWPVWESEEYDRRACMRRRGKHGRVQMAMVEYACERRRRCREDRQLFAIRRRRRVTVCAVVRTPVMRLGVTESWNGRFEGASMGNVIDGAAGPSSADS